MSQEQIPETKSEPKKNLQDRDIVQIGENKLKLNRNVDWPTMEKLTEEAAIIEDFRKNPKGDLMLEMARRSDKWVRNVLESFLVDFKLEYLKGIPKEIINDKSASVFWAVRSNLSFLAVESPDMLTTAQPKDSQLPSST